MKFILFILTLCLVVGASVYASAAPLILSPADEAKITNSQVQKMAPSDKRFYLYTKENCGWKFISDIKLNISTFETFVESFKGGAVMDLDSLGQTWKVKKIDGSVESIKSNNNIPPQIRDFVDSPGTEVALNECYGSNQSAKVSFIMSSVNKTQNAMVYGTVGGTIASYAGLRFLAKTKGWVWVANMFKKVFTKTNITLGTAVVALSSSTHGGAEVAAANHEDAEAAAEQSMGFSCTQDVAQQETILKKSIEYRKQYPSDFSGERVAADQSRLLSTIKKCIGLSEDPQVKSDLGRKSVEYMEIAR